jgi:hypothetical protein
VSAALLLISIPSFALASSAAGDSAAPLAVRPLLRLSNLATRANVGVNDNVLISGFIVSGSGAKRVLARAIGPSLSSRGISGALQDPTLELVPQNGASTFNDNWKSDAANVQPTGLAPTDDRESAILATLTPGAYTLVLRGKNNATGIAVVELYDMDQNAPAFLGNISGRAMVGTGSNVLIGGLSVGGDSAAPNMQVVIRGIGPSIASRVSGALSDPELFLIDANGDTVASNDNWKDTQRTEIQNSGVAPTDDREPAMVITLPRGSYTAIMRGKNGTSGVAVVEIYDAQT